MLSGLACVQLLLLGPARAAGQAPCLQHLTLQQSGLKFPRSIVLEKQGADHGWLLLASIVMANTAFGQMMLPQRVPVQQPSSFVYQFHNLLNPCPVPAWTMKSQLRHGEPEKFSVRKQLSNGMTVIYLPCIDAEASIVDQG